VTEHLLVGDDVGLGGTEGDRSIRPRSVSLSRVETNAAARRDGLEIVGVAFGIALVAVSVVRRALTRSAPARVATDGAVRPLSLTALATGALGGLVVGAARLDTALMRRIPAPLRSFARPFSALARPLEPSLRDMLTALEGKWRETCISAEASAVAFTRELERELVRALLNPLDLTDIVRTRVDIDALVDEIDLDRIVSKVDIEALVARLDLGELTQEVLDEIDLPSLIRESTGTITADAIEEVRYVSLDADRMVARVIDRLMRRSRRHLDAPGEPSSLQDGANAESRTDRNRHWARGGER
jgi:hypothetical protein